MTQVTTIDMANAPVRKGLLTTVAIAAVMTLTMLVFVAAAPAARAQDAAPPSEAQLQTPGSTPELVPNTETTTAAAPAGDNAMPEQPKTVQNTGAAANGGDPCPMPESAIANAPDDLAKVQEDIDRFTLCVQRAQLLERLNESVAKNRDSTDMAMGFNPALAGAVAGLAAAQKNGMPGAPGSMGMPPLPAGALGGADVSPMVPAPATAPTPTTAEGTTLSSTAPEDGGAAAAPKEPEKPKAWTIGEIFGSGNDVRARLISPEGDEVKVYNGMRLPDGKTTVVRITPAGVTVRGNAGSQALEWATKI